MTYAVSILGINSMVWVSMPYPRTPKGSKSWNPLLVTWLPQYSNGFMLGPGAPILGSFRGPGVWDIRTEDPGVWSG